MIKLCILDILYNVVVVSAGSSSCVGISRVGATFSGGLVDNWILVITCLMISRESA